MRIAILKYENAVNTCVTGPADIWYGMSRMYPVLTGTPLKMPIDVEFVTPSGNVLHTTLLGTEKQKTIGSKDRFDLIIIPAMHYDMIDTVVDREHVLIKWLQKQYSQGAELASICIGVFILAATGLLTGKKATTNWMFADLFRKRYPYVEMADDRIIVDQGRLYSCGGAFSFTSFMIYLIEKLCGHEASVIAAKSLMINVHEQPQTSFAIFRFQHDHADEAIAGIQVYMEKNFKLPLTLEHLAGRCNMSVRNFIRRFEQATTNTPLEYLQRIRIEAAKRLLERGGGGIPQVASRCGYEDSDYFRKIFKRYVAMTPREYQEKYGKRSPALRAGQ